MTFQQISYLLEVDRTKSFSQAAKNLFVAQSTVSNAISALEAELNCRIFIRSGQGLAATIKGQQVLACAQRIHENHELLTSTARSGQLSLRVCANEYPPSRNAFLLLMEEYRDQPEVQFSFRNASTEDFFDRLVLQQSDVSIGFAFSLYNQHFVNVALSKKLACQKLITIPMGICLGQGHPLYHKEDLQPADFAGERFIDHSGKPIINTNFVLAYVPINKENVILCDNGRLQKDILRKGLAYTITRIPPESDREEGLRYIPIPELTQSVTAYTDPVRQESPLVSRYLELLQEEIRKEL